MRFVRYCLATYLMNFSASASELYMMCAVYHVTKDGWQKVTGTDVGQLHYEYYKKPEDHPTWGSDPLGPTMETAAA